MTCSRRCCDDNEIANILYTMMDENLKKDARRCKVIGNSRALREHIAEEAAECRDAGASSKKTGGSSAMDVSAVAEGEKNEAPAAVAAAPSPPTTGELDNVSKGQGKVGKDQCKTCLGKGHWSRDCPLNKGKGKGKFGVDSYKGKHGSKSFTKGGKSGKGKGNGKGKGIYGMEDQSWGGYSHYGEDWGNPPDAWWPSDATNGAASGVWPTDGTVWSVEHGRLSSIQKNAFQFNSRRQLI